MEAKAAKRLICGRLPTNCDGHRGSGRERSSSPRSRLLVFACARILFADRANARSAVVRSRRAAEFARGRCVGVGRVGIPRPESAPTPAAEAARGGLAVSSTELRSQDRRLHPFPRVRNAVNGLNFVGSTIMLTPGSSERASLGGPSNGLPPARMAPRKLPAIPETAQTFSK